MIHCIIAFKRPNADAHLPERLCFGAGANVALTPEIIARAIIEAGLPAASYEVAQVPDNMPLQVLAIGTKKWLPRPKPAEEPIPGYGIYPEDAPIAPQYEIPSAPTGGMGMAEMPT